MLLYVGELKGGSGPLREGRTKQGMWHLFPPVAEAEMSRFEARSKIQGEKSLSPYLPPPLYSRYTFTFFFSLTLKKILTANNYVLNCGQIDMYHLNHSSVCS